MTTNLNSKRKTLLNAQLPRFIAQRKNVSLQPYNKINN